MKAEKLYLRFFLRFRECVSVALFLLNAACSSVVPSYSKQFIFESGKKRLEIDVKQRCTYEIGVSFLSQDGDKSVKEIFGHARKIYMPALIDISVLDNSGKIFFSKTDFGGPVLEYRYGPNPLKLVAGKIYLESGKYVVLIDVKSIERDFSDFKSEIFISGDPKVKCQKQ